jgi:hypothetical protein
MKNIGLSLAKYSKTYMTHGAVLTRQEPSHILIFVLNDYFQGIGHDDLDNLQFSLWEH